MPAYIEWAIEGRQELSRNLRSLELSMEDWKEALGSAAELLTKTFSQDVFSTKGAAVGARWRPLSPASWLTRRPSTLPGMPPRLRW